MQKPSPDRRPSLADLEAEKITALYDEVEQMKEDARERRKSSQKLNKMQAVEGLFDQSKKVVEIKEENDESESVSGSVSKSNISKEVKALEDEFGKFMSPEDLEKLKEPTDAGK